MTDVIEGVGFRRAFEHEALGLLAYQRWHAVVEALPSGATQDDANQALTRFIHREVPDPVRRRQLAMFVLELMDPV